MARSRWKLVLAATLLAASPLFAQSDPATNPDAFERFLVPVFTAPVHGAFGSEFYSDLTVWNKSTEETLRVYGLQQFCVINECPPPPDFIDVEAGSVEAPLLQPNGNPGRFIFVAKTQSNAAALNLRVFDASRSATNFGTELRVVRDRDFSAERIVLPAVPMSTRFRNTLRIYSTQPTNVVVSFQGPDVIGSPTIPPPPPQTVTLRAGENLYDPAYAIFGDFPQYPYPLTVVVEPVALCPICPFPHDFAAIWAFITVTNNETQHITTISSQP
jgi:hypothetical protein